MSTLLVRRALPGDLEKVMELLTMESLPTLGVAEHFLNFHVAEMGNEIVGAIGLEIYPDGTALLRSAVVIPGHRNAGIGSSLCQENMKLARDRGIHRLLLLTNTAEPYFARKGFAKIDQSSVTGPVRSSVEFSGACPSHAACMELML